MSKRWIYVGVPPDFPKWVLELPRKCWDCIYRKCEEAEHYCPFPDCCPEKRNEDDESKQPKTENTDDRDYCLE